MGWIESFWQYFLSNHCVIFILDEPTPLIVGLHDAHFRNLMKLGPYRNIALTRHQDIHLRCRVLYRSYLILYKHSIIRMNPIYEKILEPTVTCDNLWRYVNFPPYLFINYSKYILNMIISIITFNKFNLWVLSMRI